MTKVYLLKPYKTHGANEVISVSNSVVQELIDGGIARLPVNRDFLIRPRFGFSKAFSKSPSGIIKK